MTEKEALEYNAVHYFIAEYNRSHGNVLQFVELRQPPEPDALCLLDGKELGIEVTHLHGSDIDAERNFAHLRKERTKPLTEEQKKAQLKREQENRLVPLHQRVLAPLNKTLSDKANKHYSRSPIWLLVRNGFPLYDRRDFEQHRDQILVPESYPFQAVWLLGERDGGLLLLYKAPS